MWGTGRGQYMWKDLDASFPQQCSTPNVQVQSQSNRYNLVTDFGACRLGGSFSGVEGRYGSFASELALRRAPLTSFDLSSSLSISLPYQPTAFQH